jgi:hypothetical protein
MRFRIIQSEYGRWGDRLEPPRPVFLRSDLFAMKQIGLAEDAYDAPLTVNDRKCADVVIYQQLAFETASSGPTVTTSQTITSLAFMCNPFSNGAATFPAVPLKGAEFQQGSSLDCLPRV